MRLRKFSTSHTQTYISEWGMHGCQEVGNEVALPGRHHSAATVFPHQEGAAETFTAGTRTLTK